MRGATKRLHKDNYALMTALMEALKEPTKFQQAQDNPLWMEAMQLEVNLIQKNSTWELVNIPVSTSSLA